MGVFGKDRRAITDPIRLSLQTLAKTPFCVSIDPPIETGGQTIRVDVYGDCVSTIFAAIREPKVEMVQNFIKRNEEGRGKLPNINSKYSTRDGR
jgi:hypothetical protein